MMATRSERQSYENGLSILWQDRQRPIDPHHEDQGAQKMAVQSDLSGQVEG